MTDEKYSVYLSLFSVTVFLISAFVCYLKLNTRIDEVENKTNIAILTFENNSPSMQINTLDMLTKRDKEIASAIVILNATYVSSLEADYHFAIVMDTYSSYTKTSGVDGISEKEYTYEVIKDNEIILNEKEIPSYTSGSEIILLNDKLESSEEPIVYKIVFRFYANSYDQNHLAGTNLNSNLKIVTTK
ncbi:MAG: hypothetical protein E7164_03090 [Firmicutes bacterium]|nr:hypothetical protein [Bacillota bacterium]